MRFIHLLTPLVGAALVFVAPAPASANTGTAWRALSERPAASPSPAAGPLRFALDDAILRAQLAGAPLESDASASPAVISIPGATGKLQRFSVVESPVMAPALAEKVPFKSYAVVGIDDPSASGRIDLSTLGFHATLRSSTVFWNVDPLAPGANDVHVVNGGVRSTPVAEAPPAADEHSSAAARGARPAAKPLPGSTIIKRSYRLALASDPTYAAAVGTENVDTQKASIVNRANEIYNVDLAIRMILVANNDQLNFDTPQKLAAACGAATPCYAPGAGGAISCDGPALSANQLAIDNLIGDPNYDIGHIATGAASGGLASEGIGQTDEKAKGCTGIDTPTGDHFAVDYFSHEIGHQFGASHAFNGVTEGCNGNREESTSIEPGSGTSIMGYSGICGVDNLQDHADPYFNHKSIDQIQTYVTQQIDGATNGGNATETTTNRSPVVTVPATQKIPPRTPFTLTGSATDADGDPLVYIWEQSDPGVGAGSPLLSNSKPNGPLFRQFSKTSIVPNSTNEFRAPGAAVATAADNVRTFPDLEQIAVGNTNAASGSCPAASTPATAVQIDCYSEFLPTSARTLNFALVARDQKLAGGGVASASTTVVVEGATPFRVTKPSAVDSAPGGSAYEVTWDPAGTAANLGVANVAIRYSSDGGLTFPTTLQASTANDGAETVTLPEATTTQARFKVEAIGQPFFDVSHANLTVTTPIPTPPTPTPTPTTPTTPTTPATPATPAAPVIVPGVAPALTVSPTTYRPVLGEVPKRLRPSKKGRFTLKLSCTPVDPAGAAPNACEGVVRLTISRGKKKPPRSIALQPFSLNRGASTGVQIKLSSSARKTLTTKSLNATLTVSVGAATVSQPLSLRRR